MGLMLISAISNGAEYSLSQKFTNRTVLDDNIRLTAADHNTVVGNNISTETNFLYQSEKAYLNFIPQFEFVRYSDDVGLDGENYVLLLNSQYALNNKWSFDLQTNIREQTVGVPDLNVSGLGFREVVRESNFVSTGLNHNLSERQSLSLRYTYSETDYPDAGPSAFVGNEINAITIDYSFILDEKNQLGAELTSNFTEISDLNLERQVTSFQVSLDRQQSETLSFNLSGGFNFTESEFDVLRINPVRLERDTENVLGETYAFRVDKKFSFMSMNAGYEKYVNPNVRGGQDVSDTYSLGAQKDFNKKLTGTLSARYKENVSQQTAGTLNNNFEIFQIQAKLSYKFTRNFNVVTGYRFRTSKNVNTSAEPESNQTYVNMVYKFDPLSWSR